jgi:hypothetical protein
MILLGRLLVVDQKLCVPLECMSLNMAGVNALLHRLGGVQASPEHFRIVSNHSRHIDDSTTAMTAT